MPKAKHLTRRQLSVIENMFSGEMSEQAVLDKYNVSRNLYNKWLIDDVFAEQFEKRIAGAYRQSAAMIARYAPLAANKLAQLTESEKPETARKACLDIISMPSTAINSSGSALLRKQEGPENQPQQLSAETAGKLLAVLAEENIPQ